MNSKLTSRFRAVLLSIVVLPCALPGQTIGIRMDGTNIQIDIETIPTEQIWLSESADLVSWTNLGLITDSTSIDFGPPVAGSAFFRLNPLYSTQITWVAASNMPVARDQFTGGLIDGKLYLFGGNGANPTGTNLSRMDIYDLNTGQWSRGANYDFGIEELSSAVVSGKLYVFGGWAGARTNVSLRYDPAGDAWSKTAPKPTQIQAVPAVAWGDEILLVGGSRGESGIPVTVVEAYNTVSNTWRVITDLPDASVIPAVAICDDVLYVIGGVNPQTQTAYNKVRRFNLKTLVWLPEIQGTLPHPILATYASACPVVNGRLIIGGGFTIVHGGFSNTNIYAEAVRSDFVTAYDTHSNSFSQNSPLPEVFGDHLFLLVEDKLFALGGRDVPSRSWEEPTSRMYIGTFAGMNSQPNRAANGSQPIRSEPNRTPPAARSRR